MSLTETHLRTFILRMTDVTVGKSFEKTSQTCVWVSLNACGKCVFVFVCQRILIRFLAVKSSSSSRL